MSMPRADLARYGRRRDALLARITWALAADSRVGAAWLSGSFGRSEADEWSDLDLHVAIEDDYLPCFWEDRERLYERLGHPILIQQAMMSDSMPDGHFQLVLYRGALEVDWNVGPLSRAARPLASSLLIERIAIPFIEQSPLTPKERRAHAEKWLTFFWAMAPIAVKYVGRAESRRAASQIDLLTRALIALWKLLAQTEGPDPYRPTTNPVLAPDLDARLPRLGATIDPEGALTVIRHLCEEAERLHPNLAVLGVSIPLEVPGEVRSLAGLAEAVIRLGEQPRRTYR
ncbi:MAG: hypothetical protein ACR2PL_17675 [Dehalococcoidia bacterium]